MTTFLLSPADCRGRRAEILTRPEADFPLATQLREGRATIAEVFSFVSGLYFRGKCAYARAFGGVSLVIVPGRGLLDPSSRICAEHVHAFAQIEVDETAEAFVGPLVRDVTELAARVPGPHVLLGSVASRKYVEPLGRILGDRLYYPLAFAGRGDMSRGKLMLDAAAAGRELAYGPVPALPPRRRARSAS